ncbi:RNA polymerase sigma-70 factor [Sphingobacterium sp. HJSM2_6]|uniref:RNA polymerase sigma-70 factor n=1 Tax=Sphingobacterium sp. HJSM2_6 TaxID=3366264 RepID=UPI003BD24567
MPPIIEMSDLELLELLIKGDNKAFAEIYNRYWKSLLFVATKKLGRIEDGEEIVQDIFVSLWNRRDVLQVNTSLKNYLSASVKYRVIKHLDKQYHANLYLNSLIDNNFIEATTERTVEFDELRDELERNIVLLPERCQLVFRLSKEEGKSQKEIASALEISEKTVENHLGKAYKILRAKLAGYMMTLL